ncbi:MAG TPA: glycosyltransferase [Nitrospiraceae bacterium]|jgi:glycosyltransferase involved in cell wall biosynthesis|nr:glycosyltransferase [Nitrospiraceae bacterium]
MSSITSLLGKLPPSPKDKTGWPWTKESKPIPQVMPNGKPWPKISIVTPSYNQGLYLEETIRSVLLQNYPNLEYIVMDGGSTDNSVEIIKKYEPWLTYWVSEKDAGQADAIHRGFSRANGDVIGWLNSDDYLLSGALGKVGRSFAADLDLEFVVGGGIVVDDLGNLLRKYYSFPQNATSLLAIGQFFLQMSSFWSRETYQAVGGIDIFLRFCFDYDFFIRLAQRKTPGRLDSLLAAFRIHDRSKTSSIWESIAIPEFELIRRRHGFYSWPELVREEMKTLYIRQYHLNNRKLKLKDIVLEPAYFLHTLKEKIWKNSRCAGV